MVSIDIYLSNGIQRSPFMSIGITGLVVNLTSDKCSIHEICLVLRALRRNSSFQGRITLIYIVFFELLSKVALYASKCSMKYGPFFKPWSKTVHFKRGQRKINLAFFFLLKTQLNAVYVGNASFFKTKSETARIKREWLTETILPFLWQLISRVVRELKSCHRVILPS